MVGASNQEDDVVLLSSDDALGPDATISGHAVPQSFSVDHSDMQFFD